MEEIDLLDLIKLFWKKKLWIIGIMAIFIVMSIIYTKVIIEPRYQSTTTILFATERSINNNTESVKLIPSDNIMNYQLIPTLAQLVKSDEVAKKVAANLGMERNIKNDITVETKTNVEMLEITVRNENPEDAQKIANELSNVFIEKVKEYYKLDSIYIVDEAQVAVEPYNINLKKNVLIFACVGIIISTIYVLVEYMIETNEKKYLCK